MSLEWRDKDMKWIKALYVSGDSVGKISWDNVAASTTARRSDS